MALEWALLSYVVGAEVLMLMMVTTPGLGRLRKGIITMSRSSLRPMLAIVPFCVFLLMDIYWKYQHSMPACTGPDCTIAEQAKRGKSVVKSERNTLLVLSALLLYWLLFNVTHMLVQIEKLNLQVKQLKQKNPPSPSLTPSPSSD